MNENASANPLAIFAGADRERCVVLTGGADPRMAVLPSTASTSPSDAGQSQWISLETVPGNGSGWTLRAADSQPSTQAELEIALTQADARGGEDHELLQPCRISGTVTAGGETLKLDSPGVLLQRIPAARTGSVRLVGAAFADGHDIALLSVRAGNARGQDDDRIGVVARGPQEKLALDPRLSTTYGPHGLPRKAGIEMWLGDEDSEEQRPYRMSGLADGPGAAGTRGAEQAGATGSSGADQAGASGSITGDQAGVSSEVDGFVMQAIPLRCIASGGDAGIGVYVLLSS